MAGVKNNQMRIVSLAPSATSILCAIGAKKLLVGITKWCADVAPVGVLPKLGDCWHMNSVNEILELKPTVVIGSVPYKQETVAKLLEHPLNFLAMNPRTLGDVYADIRLLGGVARRPAQAERLVGSMKRQFAAINRKVKRGEPPLRAYCEAWPNPRISSPPWVAEVVEIAGGQMVVPAGKKVTDEEVAAGRPDVIVLAWAATGDKAKAKSAYQIAAWRDLPAIRKRNVYVLRDELLNTPGPPLIQGAQQLYSLLQDAAKEPSSPPRTSRTQNR